MEIRRSRRDVELRLRVDDPLLDDPPVRGRLAALDPLELRLSLVELALCVLGVDLVRADGMVDECDRAVLLDREEPGARRELIDAVGAEMDARRRPPSTWR